LIKKPDTAKLDRIVGGCAAQCEQRDLGYREQA